MPLLLGLNSGSSFDGVDAVIVEIETASDDFPGRPKFIGGITVDWPKAVAEKVLLTFENKLDLFGICRLNYLAGAVYAEAARSLMRRQGIFPGDLDAIGFDGQTVYQEPPDQERMPQFRDDEHVLARWLDGPYPCGLQIAEPAIVAAVCQTTTVTQFRPMEHALGGTGAPLMQYLDYVAFRDIGPVLTLNIGGIANCQLADRDRSRMMAFDTGPGNVMLDHAARVLLGKPFDAEGATAAKGKVNQSLLSELMAHPFFLRSPPRSAWRLDFGSEFANRKIAADKQLSPEDLLATFTEFAALATADSIVRHVKILDQISMIIASGGGVRNDTLMKRLRAQLPEHLRLTLSDEFGIPAQYKEAIKFAALAHGTVNGLANNIPAASGASSFAILGKVVFPPRLAKHVVDGAKPRADSVDTKVYADSDSALGGPRGAAASGRDRGPQRWRNRTRVGDAP